MVVDANMLTVFICHPLSNDIGGNLRTVISYAKYILMLGYCPLVPHWYSLILDDNDPEEHNKGIECAFRLMRDADYMLVCGEYISKGMANEISIWRETGKEYGHVVINGGVIVKKQAEFLRIK